MEPDEAARSGEITRLASAWGRGEEGALDRLIELVYDDLRLIAHKHLDLGERDAVVDTTVLVHEAFLRLAGVEGATWESRAHFFAFCSKAMRRILIDFARRRSAEKRGGTRVRVPLDDETATVEAEVEEVLVIDDVLRRLEARSPRMAQVVECRFFGGLSVADTAEVVGASVRTVEREWSRARTYLKAALSEGEEAADGGSTP